jgi:hypothetical protein
MPLIHKISEMLPTVIPLRHPALIATSFKKRKQGGYVKEWMRMCEIEGFHFPLETKPYDELEEYLGRPVVRDDTVVNSIGEYPEKDSIQSAKAYLGIDWVNVEAMLATPIGQRFYSNSLP